MGKVMVTNKYNKMNFIKFSSVLGLAAQWCPILFDSMEWVAMPSSKGSSQPRDQTQVSGIVGGFFTI